MRFRKKQVEVSAIQYDGSNIKQVMYFLGDDFVNLSRTLRGDEIFMETYEGILSAMPGDYIIRGIEGEHYPCKESVFTQTYERID